MKTLIKLTWKELNGIRMITMMFAVLVVLWQLFLLTRVGVWPQDNLPLLAAAPFFLIPVGVIIGMLYMFHMEWSTNTIYLLLSLPVRGWKVLMSKLLAALGIFVTLNLVTTISFWLTFGRDFFDDLVRFQEGVPTEWLAALAIKFICGYLLTMVVTIIMYQFAYLASRLVNRFNGLLLTVTLLVQIWLFVRVGGGLAPLFEWVPDFTLRGWYHMGNDVVRVSNQVINSAPLVVIFLLTCLVFTLSSWIYEREIEV